MDQLPPAPHLEAVEALRGPARKVVPRAVRVVGEDGHIVGRLRQLGLLTVLGVDIDDIAVAEQGGLVRHCQAEARTEGKRTGDATCAVGGVVVQSALVLAVVLLDEAERPGSLVAVAACAEESGSFEISERNVDLDLVVRRLGQVVRDPVRMSVALHVLEARVAGRRRGEDVVLDGEGAFARMCRPDERRDDRAAAFVRTVSLEARLVVHALQQGIARGGVSHREGRPRECRAFARELGRDRRGKRRDGHVARVAGAERPGAERFEHAALDGIRQCHHVVRRAHGHEVAHEHAVTPDLERMEAVGREVPDVLARAFAVIVARREEDEWAGRVGEGRGRGRRNVRARAVAHDGRAVRDGDRVGDARIQLDVARDFALDGEVVHTEIRSAVVEQRAGRVVARVAR